MSTKEPLISDQTALIYGEVVTVKPIPTRQVTQIVIEIPEEHHIAATQLLFKRNAFIMPCADKSPLPGVTYGVTTLGKVMSPDPTPEGPAGGVRAPGGLIRPEVNVTKWLAMKASDPNFQRFMGVDTEADVAEAVRQKCGVASRSEIASNPRAMQVFMDDIYLPFQSRFRGLQRVA
jgi:hypothetical protein